MIGLKPGGFSLDYPNIYLAGHLHDDWRSKVKYAVEVSLVNYPEAGINWLEPRRNFSSRTGAPGNDPRFYVPNDIQLVNRADIIAFMLEADHGNIGGTWEAGYAYALNKPVYLLDMDRENYRYDILRTTCHRFTHWSEWIEALSLVALV